MSTDETPVDMGSNEHSGSADACQALESPQLHDLSDERNQASIRLGRVVNQFRFLMEALWVQGSNSVSYSDAQLPWEQLRHLLRASSAVDGQLDTTERFVQQIQNGWRDSFTAEWHHESLLDAEAVAGSSTSAESTHQVARSFLATMPPFIVDLEGFAKSLLGPRTPLYQLGMVLGQLDFPSPTERFLTLARTSFVPNEQAADWREASQNSVPPRYLPLPPARQPTQNERRMLLQQLDCKLTELGIGLTGGEFRQQQQSDDVVAIPYLGITVENGLVYRNGEGGLLLQPQMLAILQFFMRREYNETTLQDLADRWQEFTPSADTNRQAPQLKTVRDAVKDTSDAIADLELTISQPTASSRGQPYLLKIK